MPDLFRGVGVGVGIVVAPLVRMGRPPALPAAQPVDDRDAEAERARRALAAVSADLAARSQAGERHHGGHHPRRAEHDRR